MQNMHPLQPHNAINIYVCVCVYSVLRSYLEWRTEGLAWEKRVCQVGQDNCLTPIQGLNEIIEFN